MTRPLARALTLAAVLWTAAILFVPIRGRDLPHALTVAVYAAASRVCHQRPERSFHVRHTKLPVCARCTGLYVSGAAGALLAWLGIARVPRRARAMLIAAAVPTIVTLAIEWAGLADPGSVVRAIAALPAGALTGWLFVRLLRAEGQPTTCAMIS
jgi:uncharacterized membrane protein